MPVRPAPVNRLHHRHRRALVAVPAALLSWLALTNLPISPASAKPGTMHTEIVTLTGGDATRTSAAGTSASTKGLRQAPTAAGPGWSAAIDVDEGTQAVGASWTGAPTGEVLVRGHDGAGWTEWNALEADPADGPDDATRNSGGLAWFGRDGVDRVELKVDHGTLHDLELQTMRYEEPEQPASVGTTTAGASTGAIAASSATQPAVLPRSLYTSKGWATANSGCANGPVEASGGIKAAIVHHTVNANTYAADDVPAMLASIYAFHTGSNGWCDTAYNFIVDRFGRIWEGRSGGISKAIVGGHAAGFNTGTVGVSFLGQFEPGASPTAAAPTSAALDAAGRLIGWKLGLYGIDPTGTTKFTSGGSNRWPAGTVVTLDRVSGHRDVGYTACPGQNLYDKLSTIRSVAKAAQAGGGTTTTTTTTLPPPTGDYAPFRSAWGLVTQEYKDILRRSPTSADMDFWSTRVANTWSPGQFVAQLATSAEADDKVDAVIRLYRAYFLRNPDHGGLGYWLRRRDEGHSLVWISNNFATSSEFRGRYGSLSNSAFVDRVYRNVLGRPADPSGTSFWKKKLDAGTSRGQVMANFAQSGEYVKSTADGVHVVAIYEGMLQRAVANDEYTLFVAGLKADQTSLTAIANYVYDSDEYRARVS